MATAVLPALVITVARLIAVLVVAAGGGRPVPVGPRAPCGPTTPARACGLPLRGLSAVITQVTLVPAAAVTAPAVGPVGEFLGVLGAHVPHGHEDNDKDDHDNYGQDDHELGHRTIQQAWPHRAVQARHTQPLTRAFPVCASTLDLNPC